jgi:hypothetical protein
MELDSPKKGTGLCQSIYYGCVHSTLHMLRFVFPEQRAQGLLGKNTQSKEHGLFWVQDNLTTALLQGLDSSVMLPFWEASRQPLVTQVLLLSQD